MYLLFLDVCQLYSNQKAIRVKRLVERKKVYDFIQTENCFDLSLFLFLVQDYSQREEVTDHYTIESSMLVWKKRERPVKLDQILVKLV